VKKTARKNRVQRRAIGETKYVKALRDAINERPYVETGGKIKMKKRKKKKKKNRARFVYSQSLDAYIITRKYKTTKQLHTPEEYVEQFNKGAFEDSEGTEYWCEETNSQYCMTEKKQLLSPAQSDKQSLPFGVYIARRGPRDTVMLQKHELRKDKYYELSDIDDNLIQDVHFFLDNEKKYRKMNFAHRRGILLFGPPGNGKTMAIEHIAHRFQDKARFVFANLQQLSNLMEEEYYEALADLPIVLVLEEISTLSRDGYMQSQVLSFLDGEKSWDNFMFIATTNFPEELPDNFIDRPSRFDRLYKVDNPTEKVRRAYLEQLLGKKNVHQSIINKTAGLSLAYLKELVVAAKIYGRTLMETIKEFRQRKQLIKKGFDDNKTEIGFKSDDIIKDQERRTLKRKIGFGAEDRGQNEKDKDE